ncbi:MAG: CAP domain-containing protein [Gemmataceae bacterium]|nr:CAP domain-containing protein [Gemmataceae bacterium]
MPRISICLGIAVLLALAALVRSPALAEPKDEPAVKMTKEETYIFNELNRERKEKELTPLTSNSTLIRLARRHSTNMGKQDKMDHVLDEKNPSDRAKDIGYNYMKLGENIAYGKGVELDAIHKGWMDSKPHRENILNEDFAEVGVGIITDAQGKQWFTQVFGTQLK